MTSGYYCAIFPFCGGGKKKDDKKKKAFYDWATTGIPVKIVKVNNLYLNSLHVSMVNRVSRSGTMKYLCENCNIIIMPRKIFRRWKSHLLTSSAD